MHPLLSLGQSFVVRAPPCLVGTESCGVYAPCHVRTKVCGVPTTSLNMVSADLCPERYWRGPRSQEPGEEGDYT